LIEISDKNNTIYDIKIFAQNSNFNTSIETYAHSVSIFEMKQSTFNSKITTNNTKEGRPNNSK
jgi:hypothetical protein